MTIAVLVKRILEDAASECPKWTDDVVTYGEPLEYPLPNGKVLGDCTRRDLEELIEAFERAAAEELKACKSY
jgi:hypothetical protein